MYINTRRETKTIGLSRHKTLVHRFTADKRTTLCGRPASGSFRIVADATRVTCQQCIEKGDAPR